MKYPKYNGENLDVISQKRFDKATKLFTEALRLSETDMNDDMITVCAWNCAYEYIINL